MNNLMDFFKGKKSLRKVDTEVLHYFVSGEIKEIEPIYNSEIVQIYKTFIEKGYEKQNILAGAMDITLPKRKVKEEVYVYIIDEVCIDIVSKYIDWHNDYDCDRMIYLKREECSPEVFNLIKKIVSPSRPLELFKKKQPYLESVLVEASQKQTKSFLWLIGKDLERKRSEEYPSEEINEAWYNLNPTELNIMMEKFTLMKHQGQKYFEYNTKTQKGIVKFKNETKKVKIVIDMKKEIIELNYEYDNIWEEPYVLWSSIVKYDVFPLTFTYILYCINEIEEIKDAKEYFTEEILKEIKIS